MHVAVLNGDIGGAISRLRKKRGRSRIETDLKLHNIGKPSEKKRAKQFFALSRKRKREREMRNGNKRND